jgi:hypothetical protein
MEGKKIEIVTKKKKGFGGWLITILAIVGGIFILALAIGLFFGEAYPKSESELLSLYCGKYWKCSDIELQEVYVNGVLLKEKEGGPLNLRGTLNAEENAKIKSTLDNMEMNLKDMISKDNFMITQKDLKDENLWEYNESFDTDINSNTYELDFPTLTFADGKFVLKFLNGFTESRNVLDDEMVSSITYKDYTATIESITNEELVRIESMTILLDDGTDFKLVLKNTYVPTQPNSLNRYNEVFNFKKQLGDPSQGNNSTGENSDALAADTTAAY